MREERFREKDEAGGVGTFIGEHIAFPGEGREDGEREGGGVG